MKRTRNVYHYQVKKIKKSEEIIKKNNLLDACLNGNSDVFTEIKKMRQHKPSVAASMDGVKVNVENHFKGIYEKLYNYVNDTIEMIELNNEVQSRINLSQLYEVDKVTPEVVMKAAKNLSNNQTVTLQTPVLALTHLQRLFLTESTCFIFSMHFCQIVKFQNFFYWIHTKLYL